MAFQPFSKQCVKGRVLYYLLLETCALKVELLVMVKETLINACFCPPSQISGKSDFSNSPARLGCVYSPKTNFLEKSESLPKNSHLSESP